MRFHVSFIALCSMCLSSSFAWAQSGAGPVFSADRPLWSSHVRGRFPAAAIGAILHVCAA